MESSTVVPSSKLFSQVVEHSDDTPATGKNEILLIAVLP
jgi:hypothetical protein